MFELKWSNELAQVAQRWADQCVWHHDAERVRKAFLNLVVLNSYFTSDRAQTSLSILVRTWP